MASFLVELIARYQAIAVGYLTGRVGDANLAEDLYQNVLQALLQSEKSFASLEHLRNYFFVALRNAAIDHDRGKRRSREVRLPEDGAQLKSPEGDEPPERLIVEEEVARSRRRLVEVRAAYAALPKDDQDLLHRRLWKQETFRTIHERTGVPISTLKSREDGILKKLKKTIGKAAPEA